MGPAQGPRVNEAGVAGGCATPAHGRVASGTVRRKPVMRRALGPLIVGPMAIDARTGCPGIRRWIAVAVAAPRNAMGTDQRPRMHKAGIIGICAMPARRRMACGTVRGKPVVRWAVSRLKVGPMAIDASIRRPSIPWRIPHMAATALDGQVLALERPRMVKGGGRKGPLIVTVTTRDRKPRVGWPRRPLVIPLMAIDAQRRCRPRVKPVRVTRTTTNLGVGMLQWKECVVVGPQGGTPPVVFMAILTRERQLLHVKRLHCGFEVIAMASGTVRAADFRGAVPAAHVAPQTAGCCAAKTPQQQQCGKDHPAGMLSCMRSSVTHGHRPPAVLYGHTHLRPSEACRFSPRYQPHAVAADQAHRFFCSAAKACRRRGHRGM